MKTKKTKALVFSTRSLGGAVGHASLSHYPILETICDSFDCLVNTKGEGEVAHIKGFGCNALEAQTFFSDFFNQQILTKKIPSWNEVYDKLDVSPLQQYDVLIILGGLFLRSAGIIRGGKREQVFPLDSQSLTFQSHSKPMMNALAMLKAHREYGIPLHEQAKDPDEMPLANVHESYKPKSNYCLYHGYDIPKYNIKRLDTAQYVVKKRPPNLFCHKNYDFVGGYNLMFHDTKTERFRASTIEDVQKYASGFGNHLVLLRNKLEGTNTVKPRQEYLELIVRSKYTMIVPAFDPHCFSIYRIVESLARGCLPLVHESCNRVDVEKSFGTDLSPLVLTAPVSEKRRLELLEHFGKIFIPYQEGFKTFKRAVCHA